MVFRARIRYASNNVMEGQGLPGRWKSYFPDEEILEKLLTLNLERSKSR